MTCSNLIFARTSTASIMTWRMYGYCPNIYKHCPNIPAVLWCGQLHTRYSMIMWSSLFSAHTSTGVSSLRLHTYILTDMHSHTHAHTLTHRRALQYDDVVKFDFGTHINGRIIDCTSIHTFPHSHTHAHTHARLNIPTLHCSMMMCGQNRFRHTQQRAYHWLRPHAYILSLTHGHTHSHTHTRAHAHMHTQMHTRMHKHTPTPTYTLQYDDMIRFEFGTHINGRIIDCTCMHTYPHARTRTHTRTHTNTYTHFVAWWCVVTFDFATHVNGRVTEWFSIHTSSLSFSLSRTHTHTRTHTHANTYMYCAVRWCGQVWFRHTHQWAYHRLRFHALHESAVRPPCGCSSRGHQHWHQGAHCNTLQHAATHCPIMQHTATHYNTLQHSSRGHQHWHQGVHCNTLQHAATTLHHTQHTATHSARPPTLASKWRATIICMIYMYDMTNVCVQYRCNYM